MKSVQFTVAAHIMAALGYDHGEEVSSAILASSVNADPTFVRKSLSKLSKAGLVVTKEGQERGERACASSATDHAVGHIPCQCGTHRRLRSFVSGRKRCRSAATQECMSEVLSSSPVQLREIARENNRGRYAWSDREKTH